jgi:hypothetical protein
MLCTAAGAIACQPDSSRPIGALREGLAALYDDISQLYGFVAPVVETQSYAWVLTPAFAQVGHFSEGVAAAQDPDSRLWGLVDSHGSWVVPARFGAIRPRSQGACAACDATSLLWGAIDEQGSWTIEPRFAALGSRDVDGRCVAQDASGAWGIVDDDGTWKVAPRFSQLRRLSHGLAPALEQAGGLWGFVDGEGQWRVEPRFADARPLYATEAGDEGCLAAAQDAQTRLWLFVDADGEPAGGMRPSLWKLGDLHDGLAPAQATWHDDVVSFGEMDDDHVEGVGARYGYVDATGAWQMRQQATLVDTGIEAAEI